MPNRFSNSSVYQLLNYSANPISHIGKESIVLPEEEKYDPVLFGLELELSTKLSVQKMIDKQNELFFICKSDGSISGKFEQRYECVTVPMSMKAQKKYWADWFNEINYEDFDTGIDTNNGLHIHISRDRFSEDHTKSFTWFFMNPLNRYFFSAFSERSISSIMGFTKFIEPGNMSLFRTYKNATRLTSSLGKYSVINLSRHNTIEVRLFKGIVSYSSLLKNLELVEAAYEFTDEYSDSIWGSVTLPNFLKFIENSPKNRFTCLKTFLKTMNMNRVMNEININRIIYVTMTKDSKPKEILDLLNSSGLVHNRSTMQVLNNRMGLEVFKWNNAKRIIEAVGVRKGRIHTLDDVFAKRYSRKIKDTEFHKNINVPIEVGFSETEVLREDENLY